ncbi:MAG: alpha-L-rhamnosidase C-terminal domain-containing protein, partial [Kiritimatiellia bacterium]
KGDWRVAPLANTRMTDGIYPSIVGTGSQSLTIGTSFITEEPLDDAWTRAGIARRSVKDSATKYCSRTKGWMLFPTGRPDQIHESKAPGGFKAAHEAKAQSGGVYTLDDAASPWVGRLNAALKGEVVVIPANTSVKAVWRLGDYYCAYPELVVSGGKGAKVTWGWAESLVHDPKASANAGRKGDRDEFAGKAMARNIKDVFESSGISSAFFTTPWWRCGTWCELAIETRDEPLVIDRLAICETRYPLAIDGSFECDDPEIAAIDGICRRTMEMCMHEMLFDCPYYEQQMYPGDTRIQLGILNTLTRDVRMNRFALGIYDCDRRDNGMIAMNFPTRGTQESATYTMCWIMMFRDHMMWHDDRAFLKARMPGVRNALMGLALCENDLGLLENLPGWSFMDSVNGECPFKTGVAPCGNPGEGASALCNLQYLMAMQSAAAVDEALGEKLLAAHWNDKIARLKESLLAEFWDEERGALADTAKKDRFSEHAQCMAIISGLLSAERQERAFRFLTTAEHISRASTYFSHYLFEAYSRCGRSDLICKRLAHWRRFLSWGAKTTFETQASDSRSDCHAWSACPIYFWHTAFAGVTPSSPFFKTAIVAPQPAEMKRISAKTPHPRGVVETRLEFANGGVSGSVTLPPETSGVFVWDKRRIPLKEGKNDLDIQNCGTN